MALQASLRHMYVADVLQKQERERLVWREPVNKKAANRQLFLSSGDGRTRTAVQPNHQYAFYMLILSLIVGNRLPKDRLPETYPLGLGVL